jgi:hypothetical protein
MFPQKITIDDLTNIFDSERDSLIFAMLGKILKLYDRSMTHLINKNGELRVVINAFKPMYLATLDEDNYFDSDSIKLRKNAFDTLFKRLDKVFEASMRRLQKECEDTKEIVTLIQNLIPDYDHKNEKLISENKHIESANAELANSAFTKLTVHDTFSKIAMVTANKYAQKWNVLALIPNEVDSSPITNKLDTLGKRKL